MLSLRSQWDRFYNYVVIKDYYAEDLKMSLNEKYILNFIVNVGERLGIFWQGFGHIRKGLRLKGFKGYGLILFILITNIFILPFYVFMASLALVYYIPYCIGVAFLTFCRLVLLPILKGIGLILSPFAMVGGFF